MKKPAQRRCYPPTLAWACLWALFFSSGCPPPVDGPIDEATLRRQLENVIDHLDSPGYAAGVSWQEHVVLCYLLARGRPPTPVEFAVIEGNRLDPGLTRGDVLALALGGEEARERWVGIRRFLARHDASSFRSEASVTATARRLGQTPATEIAAALEVTAEGSQPAVEGSSAPDHRHTASAPGVAYQTYFGFLHAHSHLSDGEGSALEAYEFARDEGGLDFFSLTDHGISLYVSWPWNDRWKRLRDAAETTHVPGSYVTLWGFEWSNPLLGHVSVLGSADFTHTLARIKMTDLYEWLRDRPEAFARFNHPGRGGLSMAGVELVREFNHLDLHPDAIPQMVGLELWNKDEGFDRYYYSGSWNDDPASYLDVGLRKGWQLGTLGGQDNHQKEWGTRNDFRTAVLAIELTREAILDAYAKRRIYATEDKDLFLDFRASGFPMGSHLTGVAPHFEVTARDGSGDAFESVRLVRNGVELESLTVSGNPISVTFTDADPTGADYYYVIVTQTDDGDVNGRNDEAISSPIWIDGPSP